jgi:nucleotide-binding universal stress UspA family protein
MNILVPLDGSQLAEQALTYVEQIARQPKAALSVRLVRVIPVLDQAATMGVSLMPSVAEAPALEESRVAQLYLAGAAQRLEEQGIAVSTLVCVGQPAAAIIAAAHKQEAELIIMASHGRTGLSRLALGSVTAAVVRDAHVPVLVVRAGTTAFPAATRSEPFTVLVPVDGSALSEAGLMAALPLAQIFSGAVRLFEVLPNVIESGERRQQRFHLAIEYLSSLERRISGEGVMVYRAVAWGDPAEQIALEVERYQTDLIALATHGRIGIDRLINGSVTEALLNDSPVPVLAVHTIRVRAHLSPA